MSHSTQTNDETTGETEHLTTSELHWLFADPRCRTTLEALEQVTLPADLDTLATEVATIESDQDTPAQADHEAVAATLHHSHLPKMDRLGVVEYDPENTRIE